MWRGKDLRSRKPRCQTALEMAGIQAKSSAVCPEDSGRIETHVSFEGLVSKVRRSHRQQAQQKAQAGLSALVLCVVG